MFSKNAITVLERRYLKDNETIEDMFHRVAHHIAKGEGDLREKFYRMMIELKFLPNSPTLMNAGRELGQLAACFVLPIDDTMEGIFDTLKNAALIHKSGGGTGFSFSRLRPKNSKVGTTGGVASGPVSFMRIFNTATEQVKQGGTRRGANMGILRVDHPDILEFITSKENNQDFNNFNISVGLTHDFMRAVDQKQPYDLINPKTKEKAGRMDAKYVFQLIVKQAWKNGDPGIIFLDRINEDNPTPELGEIEATNPCGEQPLLPYEACVLGSINLTKFIDRGGIDMDALRETVYQAVRFLDNSIDVCKYPLPEIDKIVKRNRKIGLGVMGFADMLCQLKIPYNSQKAIDTAEFIMSFIQNESHRCSMELGLGVPRNATTTTIAPTGSLSIIADCSSGVEPLFAISFTKTVMDNDKLVEVNPYFEKVAKEEGFYSEELMKKIARTGSIHGIEEIPQHVRDVFVTAYDVSPEWHIRMQAAFQKYTDNAVSKTVNLPRDATESDVAKVYSMAYKFGCKGVTVYRDGSKDNQVLSFDKPTKPSTTNVSERPTTLQGFTTEIIADTDHLYVTVNELNGKPFEIFATVGKSGMSTTASTEAIGRLVSLALRSGVEVDKVINQLKGIGGASPVFQDKRLILSIPDAIAHILAKKYIKAGTVSVSTPCPDCGGKITFEEGCVSCHSCGYSKCG